MIFENKKRCWHIVQMSSCQCQSLKLAMKCYEVWTCRSNQIISFLLECSLHHYDFTLNMLFISNFTCYLWLNIYLKAKGIMLGVFLYIFEVKKEFLVCISLSLLYITYYLVEVVKVRLINFMIVWIRHFYSF